MLDRLVNIILLIVLIATMLPTALNILIDVDTSAWTSTFPGMATMWNLLPLLGIVCVVIILIRAAQGKGGQSTH